MAMKLVASFALGAVIAVAVPDGTCNVQAVAEQQPCMLVGTAEAFAGAGATDCGHVFGDRTTDGRDPWSCAEERLAAREDFLLTYKRRFPTCASGLDRPPQDVNRPSDFVLVGRRGSLYLVITSSEDGIIAVDTQEVELMQQIRRGGPFSFDPISTLDLCPAGVNGWAE